ncbi:MAG: efflux RND transporter periplasmic adaptor subunit [Deltaproteobacteria bacterium]
MSRSLGWGVVTSAIVVGLITGCGSTTSPAPHEAPAHVENAIPESGLATVHFTAEAMRRLAIATSTVEANISPAERLVGGEVTVPPGQSITVTAPVAGVVSVAAGARLPIPGAHVQAGETLARLVPITLLDRDARARAEREVPIARAALVPAEARLTRLETLTTERATSARLVEEATATRDVAQAELDAAEARALATRRRPLMADVAMTVRAPFAGIVRACAVAPDQAVAAGSVMFELVAAEALQVRVAVYAGDLPRLDASMPARVRPLGAASDAGALEAQPVGGPPTSDPFASTVDRFYALPDDARFSVGERVLVGLSFAFEEQGRTVPRAAIVLDASGASWVYVCAGDPGDERAFVRTRIDPIRSVGDRVVFSRGPAVGTCIVTEGAADVFGSEFAPGH